MNRWIPTICSGQKILCHCWYRQIWIWETGRHHTYRSSCQLTSSRRNYSRCSSNTGPGAYWEPVLPPSFAWFCDKQVGSQTEQGKEMWIGWHKATLRKATPWNGCFPQNCVLHASCVAVSCMTCTDATRWWRFVHVIQCLRALKFFTIIKCHKFWLCHAAARRHDFTSRMKKENSNRTVSLSLWNWWECMLHVSRETFALSPRHQTKWWTMFLHLEVDVDNQ